MGRAPRDGCPHRSKVREGRRRRARKCWFALVCAADAVTREHIQARGLVRRSSGVERTRELARAYADKALETLQHLPESEARGALEGLTERVVKRTW